jgi:hypothetical protein
VEEEVTKCAGTYRKLRGEHQQNSTCVMPFFPSPAVAGGGVGARTGRHLAAGCRARAVRTGPSAARTPAVSRRRPDGKSRVCLVQYARQLLLCSCTNLLRHAAACWSTAVYARLFFWTGSC